MIGIIVGAISVSLTWFAKMNSIDDLEIGGSVLSQYFDSGTGTETDPFVITRPKHWENLVWLHNNVSNFYQAITDENVEPGQQNDQGYYFQVGKQVNGQGEYYVYDYTNEGLINPNNSTLSSKTLNLRGLSSLIPIGCDTKPFLGVVNGHGITVSGFEVLGFEDVNYNLQHDIGEAGFNDVGIFGYIGNDSAVQDIFFNDFTIHLANADAYRSNNTNLHDNSFHASAQNGPANIVYAGYIAGHMHYSSSVERVYVNNCTIDGGAAATSGFGYFGVVENQNGATKPTPLEEIEEIKQSGDNNNFGGSIDMYGVFERLQQIVRQAKTNNTSNGVTGSTSYVNSEVVIKNDVSGEEEIFNQTRTPYTTWASSSSTGWPNTNPRTNPVTYIEASTEWGGEFTFASDNYDGTSTTSGNIYEALFGQSSHYTKTVTTYTFTDQMYDCFFIKNGDNYLNHRYYATVQPITDEDKAAGWRFDNAHHLYTKVFDVTYYLVANNYSLTMSTSASTEWYENNDEFYTSINGINYYLDYDQGWILSPLKDRYLMSDGNNNYISINNFTIGNTQNVNDTMKWFLTNADGNTAIGFMYNNATPYYLGNNNEELVVKTTPTTWTKDGTSYYVTIQGIRFYLCYENNLWSLKPESGYKVSSGNNYLSIDNGNVSNGTNANTRIWQFSSSTGNTYIYSMYNGNIIYLSCGGTLELSSSPFTWKRNGNLLYCTIANHDYYLIYDNGWRVTDVEFYKIHDSNGNYLVANGNNGFSNGNSSEATHFYFSNTEGTYPTGTINYVYANTVYYLNLPISNSIGTLQSSSSNSTNWLNDGNSIYYEDGDYTYYLEYDNVWHVRRYADAYYISDGTNYIALNGTSITNTTDVNNALLFTFQNGGDRPNGTIKALGTNYYLRDNNGTLQYSTTSSNWSNDGSNLYSNSKYLAYYNGWGLYSDRSGYYISRNSYYLNLNGNSLQSSTTPTTLWTGTSLSNVGSSGNIRAINTTSYIYCSTGNNARLSVSNSTDRAWNSSGNRLYFTYDEGWLWTSNYTYTIQMNAGNVTIARNSGTSPSTTNSQFVFTPVTLSSKATHLENTITNTVAELTTVTIPYLSISTYTSSKNGRANYSNTIDRSLTVSQTQLQECQKIIQNNVNSSNPTYFPLRVDKVENTDNYPYGYAVSDKNTGYIVSGANLTNANSEYQRQYGDIRVSGFTISNIADSYANGKFSTIYTVDDTNGTNSVRALTEKESEDSNFTEARDGLGEALNTRVYGLHFMDATISKNNTVRAKNAKILGRTYTNYQLPQDSIDFNVYQKGEISFFAGNYFTNNNAFFSLHRIYRDSNNDISNIFEIEEIYWHQTRKDKANYVYKFTNNTYTDKDGRYTGKTSLDTEYSSTPIFKTSWITNPTNLTADSAARLFYFTIPCNAGEYALGSASGKTGAYLCYLDIAANGGDSILDYMKDPENATTFSVDYRSSVNAHNHCIIEIGAQFQSAIDNDDLKITVSFDNSPATVNGTEYTNGLYVIHVTNLTGAVFRLSVMLIDDNDYLYDDFNYAYKIVYTNQTYTDQVIMGTTLFDSDATPVPYWKRMAIFDIPSTGTAGEIDYTQD